MNKSIQIFVTCFLGACIGSLVSLKVNPLFWWVGALVGALVAYLSYNVQEVIRAIPVAYRHAVNWRPNKAYWAYWRKGFTYHFNMAMIFIFALYTLASIATSQDVLNVSCTWCFLTFIGLFSASIIAAIYADTFVPKDVSEKSAPCATCPNVFRFYFWIVPRWMYRVIKRVPQKVLKIVLWTKCTVARVATGVKTFVVKLFVLIHSEIRLLCALDAALGAGIGYFAGNALIGAIAGGVLGVLNYEIISVRVLKLTESKK